MSDVKTVQAAPPSVRAMTNAEWGMMALLSVLWGGSFLFNAVAVREVPVFSIVAFRVTLAALVLQIVARLMGLRVPATRQTLLAFFGMSLLNNVIPFNLIVFGQASIDSGLASILNATTPLFTILIAHVYTTDEKLGWRKGVGVVLGFLGVVVLFSDRDLIGNAALVGQLACVLAAFSYGVSGIFGRRFARFGLEPIVIAAGQLTISALIMLPLAFFVDHPFSRPMPSLTALVAMSVLAIASTAGAYILFFRILTRTGATNISLVTLLVPCSAILFGSFFLGENLGLREVAGFVIIAAGLLVIDGRVLRAFGTERR